MKKIPFNFDIDIIKSETIDEDADNWYVEGFCGTTDFDLQSDIITEDAFKNAESDLLENNTVLFNHDVNMPIGKVVETRAEENGLWVKILLSKTVPDIWKKVQEGIISKFSIRGQITDAIKKYVKELGKIANIISGMSLLECSLVALPANPKARTTAWYIGKAISQFIKQGGEIPEMKIEKLEDVYGILKSIAVNSEEDIKTTLSDIESFLKDTDKPEDLGLVKESGDKWTQEEIDGLVKDLEDAKKAKEDLENDNAITKESGEKWTQEEIDGMIKELEEIRDKNVPEIPRKKSGDSYSQEEVDGMVKELADLKASNEELDTKVKDVEADTEVEKQWEQMKDNYEEKDVESIKGILKKSVMGENLSSAEVLTLTTTRVKKEIPDGETLDEEGIDAEARKDIILKHGIKIKVKTS